MGRVFLTSLKVMKQMTLSERLKVKIKEHNVPRRPSDFYKYVNETQVQEKAEEFDILNAPHKSKLM